MHRRTFVASIASTVAAASLTRGLGAQESDTREIEDLRGVQTIPANPQAVVSLGEEFLLADLLELGIKPIAAAGNYEEAYIGIDPALTEGLEPFTLWEMDVEALSQLSMDLILVPEVYYTSQQQGFDLIAEFAPMVVIPTNSDWQDNFTFLASVFGKEAEAEEKIAEVEADIEQTAADLALEGHTATFATIYPGAGELTLWLTDQLAIVQVGMAIGLTVVPDAADYDTDQIGRARISLEQSNLLEGETLLMLQTTGGIAEDEEESYEELLASPSFQVAPAVQNDRVFIVERVGFPGEVPGRRNLLARFREIFG